MTYVPYKRIEDLGTRERECPGNENAEGQHLCGRMRRNQITNLVFWTQELGINDTTDHNSQKILLCNFRWQVYELFTTIFEIEILMSCKVLNRVPCQKEHNV